MSVFLIYSLLLIAINLICVLGLRYFGLAFIYNEAYRMFGAGFVSAVLLSVILLLIFCAVAYFVSKPFDTILKKIKNENYKPTEDEIKICLGSFKKLNILTIIAALFGFFIGQLIMVIRGVKTGLYDADINRIALVILQAIGFGALGAISTINGLDRYLAPLREKLKLRSISQFKKQQGMNISSSIRFTFIIALYFTGMNMLAVMYGAIINQAGLAFLNKALLCLVLSEAFVVYPILNIILSLRGRIKQTAEAMTDIAVRGDLSKRMNITVLDDFGNLTTSINQTMETFSSMISDLTEKTESVSESADVITESAESASAALSQMTSTLSKINDNSTKQNNLILQADKNIEELTQSVETVKKRVVDQTLSVENISSSVSEMTANIASVAETAKKAQETSDRLTNTSAIGREAIGNAIATMKDIQKSSNEVRDILKVIQNIASQTNLLSMNAAIEAAHAGEFGQGFAVVADEVRSLAESSSKSTKEIQKHIVEMTNTINNGVEAIYSAGESFTEIAAQVEQNAQFVSTISAAMEEQSAGAVETQRSTVEVVEAVKAVDELTNAETEAAEKIRNFMATVVSASKSTMTAVAESISATENLQQSIEKVDYSASSNKDSVAAIKKHMEHFTI